MTSTGAPQLTRTVPLMAAVTRYRTVLLAVGGVFFLLFVILALDLTLIVTKRFNGRRWNLPSRIYSDVAAYTAGQTGSPETLVSRLDRLYYVPSEGPPDRAGRFRRSRDTVEIYLRDFPYPGGQFHGFPATVVFEKGRVKALVSREGTPLEGVVLEPELIGSVYDRKLEDRTLVRGNDVPKVLTDAVLTTEDREFFRHGGVSVKRVVGALLRDIKKGSAAQGGSTLTQQLVKNLYLTPRRSLRRKVVEAAMAIILDALYSKQEILEAYLNEIYLGQRGSISITGVGEASRYYFGKNVSDLRLPEAALLAAMIKAPNAYSPFKNPKRALERRQLVLAMMWQERKITAAQMKSASEAPLTPRPAAPSRVVAPHFVDFVQQQLQEKYGSQLETEGLRVYTTLDVDLQRAAQRSVTDGLAELEKKYRRLRLASKQGSLQGALIVLDPRNGAVRALVGGRDYALSQFNRVTQAHRQPGSLFKPFVYLAAFSRRDVEPPMTPATLLMDQPITVQWGKGAEEEMWSPQNFDGKFRGPISARRAVELSINIPAVRVAVGAGLPTVVAAARAAGISSRLQGYPSLALGAFEISPMEIAAAYSVFATGGVRVEPNAIVGVLDASGRLLERRESPLRQVLPPDAVFLVNSLMRGVVDRGTGASVRSAGFRGILAGKTGTTNDGRDAWFVGFSPRFLAAVWVGYDDNRGLSLSGTEAAVPIFTDFLKSVPSSLFEENFPAPPNIVLADIDPETGLLVTPSCPQRLTEVFLQGTEPMRTCNVHGEAVALGE